MKKKNLSPPVECFTHFDSAILPCHCSTARRFTPPSSHLLLSTPPSTDRGVQDEIDEFPWNGAPGGRFGLELTFTNDAMVEEARNAQEEAWGALFERHLAAWLVEIQRVAPRARIEHTGKDLWEYSQVTVTLPLWCSTPDSALASDAAPDAAHDGDLRLFLHHDDWVVEVGSSPLTVAQAEQHCDFLQRTVWSTAAAAGLVPHPRVGGGHIHLEYASHFGDDAQLLRNFIVDLFNRPLLFLGGMSLDLLNAPPLAILGDEQRAAFVAVLAEFDASPPEARSIVALRTALATRVYTRSFLQINNHEMRYYVTHQDKYHAVNVLHQRTIELRGLHPQRSARALLSLMRVFEARIAALRSLAAPLAYVPCDLSHACTWSVDRLMEKYTVALPIERVRQVRVRVVILCFCFVCMFFGRVHACSELCCTVFCGNPYWIVTLALHLVVCSRLSSLFFLFTFSLWHSPRVYRLLHRPVVARLRGRCIWRRRRGARAIVSV